jgi:hypothetical protein
MPPDQKKEIGKKKKYQKKIRAPQRGFGMLQTAKKRERREGEGN